LLTDAKVRAAKPRAKSYKLSDANRLYLLVTPSGGKLWRWNYEYAHVICRLRLGCLYASPGRLQRQRTPLPRPRHSGDVRWPGVNVVRIGSRASNAFREGPAGRGWPQFQRPPAYRGYLGDAQLNGHVGMRLLAARFVMDFTHF